MPDNGNLFCSFLSQHDDSSWTQVIDELAPAIHQVDRRATRIWFAFFPVKLYRALAEAPNPEEKALSLQLKGKYRLADQVDSSAEFLYGHRFWPTVKRQVAVCAVSGAVPGSLAGQIREVAQRIAAELKVDSSLVIGITAVAFGTLQQVGLDLFKQPPAPDTYGKNWNRSPDRIVADRQKDDGQGLLGFLKTVDKEFTVTFRECQPDSTFKIVNLQDVTMAATQDKRPHHLRDQRCMPGEGPIPVECRTSTCGTCWVGVLSPTEKISPPGQREHDRWVYFGYEGFTGEKDSPIRLACQLKASGNITIVIPPWHGMIGKLNGQGENGAA
ncbi:MAG TPA: hypothetical protein VJ302_14285 [Blastocatellia bacterium]|nr:hypothetical protein [Blastocatellia bacterium]